MKCYSLSDAVFTRSLMCSLTDAYLFSVVDLMEVKSINGYDLSEFVSASASDEVQVVTGPVEVAAARIVADLTADNVIVDQCRFPLRLNSTRLNNYQNHLISLTSLRPISDFSDMDELVVLGDVTVPSDAPLLGKKGFSVVIKVEPAIVDGIF